MNRAKIIFNQTLMISTAILFGLGVQALIGHLLGYEARIEWPWYIPLSIILTGFLCSVPTLLLIDEGELTNKHLKLRSLLHFILLWAIVSFCGFIFKWYSCIQNYIPIAVMYILIYGFVWVATMWITKSDENKINKAIKDIQDEE